MYIYVYYIYICILFICSNLIKKKYYPEHCFRTWYTKLIRVKIDFRNVEDHTA